jgi:hypothetical protein
VPSSYLKLYTVHQNNNNNNNNNGVPKEDQENPTA